jgi:hypothetical protein
VETPITADAPPIAAESTWSKDGAMNHGKYKVNLIPDTIHEYLRQSAGHRR